MSTDYGSLPDIPANLLAKIRLSSLRERPVLAQARRRVAEGVNFR
ncbi:MAG TPA: hypothetical protein VD906_16075 [Caulobacteraceae bacterium]|nr:hypothetical protein [Caulobacteraceae bacterium]